jgi:hypothetical protein
MNEGVVFEVLTAVPSLLGFVGKCRYDIRHKDEEMVLCRLIETEGGEIHGRCFQFKAETAMDRTFSAPRVGCKRGTCVANGHPPLNLGRNLFLRGGFLSFTKSAGFNGPA